MSFHYNMFYSERIKKFANATYEAIYFGPKIYSDMKQALDQI